MDFKYVRPTLSQIDVLYLMYTTIYSAGTRGLSAQIIMTAIIRENIIKTGTYFIFFSFWNCFGSPFIN